MSTCPTGQLSQDSYTWQQLQEDLEEENVAAAKISQNRQIPTGRVSVSLKSGEKHQLVVTDVNEVEELFKSENMTSYQIEDVPQENTMMTTLLPVILTGVMMFVLILFMTRSMGGGGGSNAKMMNFGKSRARMSTDKDKQVTFQNVAGLEEEKEDLEEIVDFLKEPQKYTQVGARIPKGVILVGLPEQVRRCWQRRWRAKRECLSFPFPVLILWKCLWAWELPASGISLRRKRKMPPVLSLSMRSMRWQEGAAPEWEAAMTSGNRR